MPVTTEPSTLLKSSATTSNGTSKKQENQDETLPLFVVTGFGPFHGVSSNPTTVLAQGLQEYLSSNTTEFSFLVPLTETIVLETSAQGVRAVLDKLYHQAANNSTGSRTASQRKRVLLHLGVDSQATTFRLEACAYNDASFRVPDEQGYQPAAVSIVGDDVLPIGAPLHTQLNVHQLLQDMKQFCSSVAISQDPGRFVCNYTYCYSLFKSRQCHKDCRDPSTQCLFVHVPPFETIPANEQFYFLSRLMKRIYEQCMEAQEE